MEEEDIIALADIECAIKTEEYNTGELSKESLQKAINVIEKQAKVMNEMAKDLTTPLHDELWIIKYYTKKVEQK